VHILLAEDDDGHARLVEKNLARVGFVNRIHRVHDGQEALDYVFRQGDYEHRDADGPLLILLDVKMPRVDGVEALARIKGDARTSMLPIIMLTTTDDPREVQRCYELGCNVYITKPMAYEAFVEAIHRLGLFLQVVTVVHEVEMQGA
jgi:CheY-like chemotaxis protein